MRLLAIGDIHGHLAALNTLIDAVQLAAGDQLVFLGDYVDKGPDVRGVIERLLEISEAQNAVFLRGNHDQMMVDAFRDDSALPIWECLGGDAPLTSYGVGDLRTVMKMVPADHLKFLAETCVDYFETERYIFVHGGIRPDFEPSQEKRERLLWTTLSSAAKHSSDRTIVCGHSSQRDGNIVDLGHTICIDTGITDGGWLTCLVLDTFRFWQANQEGKCRSGTLSRRLLNP